MKKQVDYTSGLSRPDMSLVVHRAYNCSYLNGFRVLNPKDPIGCWRMSKKFSPTWCRLHPTWGDSFYVPHDITVAENFLRSVPLSLITLDTQPPDWINPQVVWVKFDDPRFRWAIHVIQHNYSLDPELNGRDGFLGDAHYHEMSKLRCFIRQHAPMDLLFHIALKAEWLPELARRLNALHRMAPRR